MPMTREEHRAVARWIVKAAVGVVGYAAVLFLAAGRLDWLWGWVFIAAVALVIAAHPILLIPLDPGLLAEREKGLRDKRVPRWDKWVAGLGAGVFPVASWIVAGLDVRFGWTGPVRLWVHLAGLGLFLAGAALFLWAMASNSFFAEGVRIQTDRGHRVAEAGPYRFVRHPGYAGAIMTHIGNPLLLGSPLALAAGLVAAALYVVRTYLEDKFLRRELLGYEEYTGRTRFRLLPGIW
ncbi:MAG TPA: isoprenylcysteine carboxylmethyltransferase family protein [Terriglobales bacterium]|nr:isoprenylcysteine carboxylmethyltransferase family protein [Terriglobales bacterium]